MFKLSNQCTAMLGFSHDESYSLAAIVNRLPTGYEIPKDIAEDFKGIFVVTRKIDYRGYCMERPVLVFEYENLMKESYGTEGCQSKKNKATETGICLRGSTRR